MSETLSAALTEEKPHKTLRWGDGVALALGIPTGLFATMGFTIGAIGAWGAIAVWGAAALIALLQNFCFAEMASMFPEKLGGIALYAHEGLRRYAAPLGAVATFGYWMGWSLTLGFVGETIGTLIQGQWFAHDTGTVHLLGTTVGLAQGIAVATVVLAFLINLIGIKVAASINAVIGALFAVVLLLLAVVPFIHGHWSGANLTWHVGSWKVFLVWIYVAGWVAYGTELCATFAPEYRNTVKDTSRALKVSSALALGFFVLVPLGVTGSVGEKAIAANPVGYAIPAFNSLFNGGADIAAVIIVAAFFLLMISSTADASRALYGLAKDDMTIRQLGHLNRRGVPAVALAVDCVINVILVLFVSSPLGILLASNLGYFLAIVLALVGYLLLRRDRPAWPRPIRLGRAAVPLASVLLLVNLVLLAVGATNPSVAGYGGLKETLIGLSLLALSIVLLTFRRLVQDRTGMRWQEKVPDTPEHLTEAASAGT
jgi:amino acid transporter